MIRRWGGCGLVLLTALAAGRAAAECDYDAMRGDLLKLGRGESSASRAWQKCLDEQIPGEKHHEALRRVRAALGGDYRELQADLDQYPLGTILDNLKGKWQEHEDIARFCLEAELRAYAAALWRRAPTVRGLGFRPLVDLGDALLRREMGPVHQALGVIARWDPNQSSAGCLSALEEAVNRTSDKDGATAVFAKSSRATCTELLAQVRAIRPTIPSATSTATTAIANCPPVRQPRLKSAVDAWCAQPDATRWGVLVDRLSAGGGGLSKEVAVLVRANRPSSLTSSLEALRFFETRQPMGGAPLDALVKLRQGLIALESLQRSLPALRRAAAFREGMELLLQGHPADVRSRLDREPEWGADSHLQALDVVARFWASGNRPTPDRPWNALEQEVFAILGAPLP